MSYLSIKVWRDFLFELDIIIEDCKVDVYLVDSYEGLFNLGILLNIYTRFLRGNYYIKFK